MTFLAYAGAALAEIAGCFAFRARLRPDRSPWWILPGVAPQASCALLLTLVDSEAAGRTYVACSGVCIAASILWLWVAEGHRRDRWNLLGGAVCQVGTAIILLGPRG